MPRSFLRGRWLRTFATGAALCLSIAAVNSPAMVNGQDAADAVAQLNIRTPIRDVEAEDRTQYPGLTFVKPGLSTSAARKQAIADLSLERLTPDAQRKAQSVLKNLGLFRRLPTVSFECDPEVYNYFLKNPDVAVSTWARHGDFRAVSTAGNGPPSIQGRRRRRLRVGDVELFLQTPLETLIHCDGAFKSPLLTKPIVARSLMRLHTTFAKDQDGRVIGTHSGDVFVEFPSHAVEAVAKVISPVSHGIADRNFKQMTLFVHLMSQAMAKHPGWVEITGNKLDGVSKQKKLEFLEVASKSYTDSRRRLAAVNSPQTFSPDEVLTPFRQWNAQGSGLGSTQLPTRSASSDRPIQSASQPGSSTLRN